MQNYRHSSAGFAAQPGRSRFEARRTTWCPSRLDEQRLRPGAKLSHPQVQSQLRGWRGAISPAEPSRGKKLPRLFVARGLEEISVTLRVAGTLEKLSVPGKPLKPRRQPLFSLQRRLCAQPRCPCPPGLQLAVSQHLPGGAAAGTDTERTGSLSGPLPPGLSGLGLGGEGNCGPRDGDSPAAAGARRHPAARGAQGGWGGGHGGFPSPQRVISPIPPPIPDFIYK